jgi:sulfhydrogenase subunit beta (sulfur reductase)
MGNSKFYTLKKSDTQKFIESLAGKMKVFAPVKDGPDYNFKRINPGEKVNLDGYSNTEFPPRQIFLPEGETILEFGKGKISEKLPVSKAAIFGIRPCDVHALLVLDRVMLGHDYFESHYKKRRENTLILALVCKEPGENCFCESMGTSSLVEAFDLLFTDQGDHFHVEVGTESGEKIVSQNSKLFSQTVDKAGKPETKCKKIMKTENLPEIMKQMRESKIWEDVAKRCVSCASCTFSCPTCFCFNLIHDTDISNLEKGKVKRELDYCMLLRYSRVAGGVVFREPRVERVKQFFYHKLVYGHENEGLFHCIGCGRCITECMAKIDITEEVKKIRDEYARKK